MSGNFYLDANFPRKNGWLMKITSLKDKYLHKKKKALTRIILVQNECTVELFSLTTRKSRDYFSNPEALILTFDVA
jgi:hypothetical protein